MFWRASICNSGSESRTLSTYKFSCCFKAKSSSDCMDIINTHKNNQSMNEWMSKKKKTKWVNETHKIFDLDHLVLCHWIEFESKEIRKQTWFGDFWDLTWKCSLKILLLYKKGVEFFIYSYRHLLAQYDINFVIRFRTKFIIIIKYVKSLMDSLYF
jgi:hypothetical protein